MLVSHLLKYGPNAQTQDLLDALAEMRERVHALWFTTAPANDGWHHILLLDDLAGTARQELTNLLSSFHIHWKFGFPPENFFGADGDVNAFVLHDYLVSTGGFGVDPAVHIPAHFDRLAIVGGSNLSDPATIRNDEIVISWGLSEGGARNIGGSIVDAAAALGLFVR